MKTTPFSLPLSSPLATASGTIEAREGVLVRYDHRGETGIGEATPLPGWTESLTDCRAALDTAAAAETQGGHTAAMLELAADSVPAARHGFATALLDADARADGVPLYRWFDADRHCETVPVNATVGDSDPADTADAVARAVDQGFDCCKLKVGARSVAADVERVRAVRDRVGDHVRLRADANGAWSREQATRAFDAVADLGVDYVEQPLAAEDLSGHADLRGGPVGVALDESLIHRRADAVLSADAADVLILKPMVLGGPGNAHTLALRAREQGIEPVVTTTIDGVVARLAALHVAAAVPDIGPCGLTTGDRLARDLAPDPTTVADGEMTVPQRDGLGVDPDEVTPDA
ncbi:mandelate racemase/muconate lactonizing enzyme family protein [Haloarcula salinisoli]|uniref:o-succinylbenzoate synthase n=1 Tax=Haloarcula salinisoli TaxID=2487746 RepID=A0A8J7YL65_9EURY|nr:o-succinylbenzoate synthase [Halomicroarcula salinisoli]MBX0285318.1 o-succinylbenzoate synthase [Halomicroarcula salinisoli]MBX0303203.1 o-succinylbenzoate synthase [Halomicroarcula salinisoli]